MSEFSIRIFRMIERTPLENCNIDIWSGGMVYAIDIVRHERTADICAKFYEGLPNSNHRTLKINFTNGAS